MANWETSLSAGSTRQKKREKRRFCEYGEIDDGKERGRMKRKKDGTRCLAHCPSVGGLAMVQRSFIGRCPCRLYVAVTITTWRGDMVDETRKLPVAPSHLTLNA